VVGYQIALRTTNGGTTWISRSFNSIQWLDAASLGANDLAFIVGNGGVIARSTDGGGTWIWPTNTFSQTLSCSFVDANTGTICGEAGLIARTTDKGATWTVQYHGEDPDHFYDVQFLNPDMGAVVGQKYSFGNGGGGGFVLFTSNGGTTWRSSYPPGPAPPLFAVHFVDPNVGMVTGTDWNTGSDGRVYYTTNRGLDWTDVSPGLTVSFGDVHLLSEDIAFLVGSDGTILQTSNGGMDWLPQESGTTRNLSDICFANDSVAYVVGDSGVVLFSSDAGATWLTRTSPVEEPLRSASFTDANIGTVVGGGVLLNGRIYRTVDGAQTWEDQSPGTSNYLTSVSFVDANTGWAVGAEGTIFHTTTGGVGIEPPVALIAPPDGAVVSTDTVVLMWHEGSSGVDRYWLEGATDSLFTEPFIDSLSTDTSKTLYQRQHNQTYWWRAKAHNSVGWGPLSEVWSFFVYQEIPSSPMLLLPDSGATGVSTTPTFSWNPSLGTEYYAIQLSDTLDFSRLVVDEDSLGATSLDITGLSVNSTYYWRVSARNALGTSNWSEEWSFTTLLTGVVEEHPVPVEFSLSQNYPNPFNPTTTIRYGLPLQAHVTLEVFNILGQRVSVLMDEAQDAGYHEVTFGGGTLSSGLYFYRLRAGDFVETRKLVLVR